METLKRRSHRPPHLPFTHTRTAVRHSGHKSPRSATATATERRKRQQELQEQASTLRHRIRSARIARREDWTLGPLAPRRDIGDHGYGTVSAQELDGRKEVKAERGGGWGGEMVYEGDRVIVVGEGGPESRERGKIGKVAEVKRKEGAVVVEGLNMVDVKTPSYVLLTEPGSPPIQTVPLPIPLSSVRLVATFKTGRTITDDSGATVPEEVDKIVSRLVRLPISEKARIRAARRDGTATRRELELFEEDPDYEGTDLRPLDGRFVAGSNEVWGHWAFVDWPKEHKETVAEKRQKKEVKEHDCDTLRFEVEEHTWTPTLLRAPMPAGVIDELRNKYGQHRTRHDPQYQLAMEGRERRRAEYKAWAESTGGMLRTPARPKEGKKTVGSVGLRRKLLEQIGEVMAAKGIEMTKKREKETEKYLQRVKVKVVEDGGAGRMVGRAWDGDAIDREVEGETMSMPDANNSVLWRAADRAAEERRGESPSV